MAGLGKKILIGLGIGVFIPPVSVLCFNILLVFGCWYFVALGIKAKIRSWKCERLLRREQKRRQKEARKRGLQGGTLYPAQPQGAAPKLLTHTPSEDNRLLIS